MGCYTPRQRTGLKSLTTRAPPLLPRSPFPSQGFAEGPTASRLAMPSTAPPKWLRTDALEQMKRALEAQIAPADVALVALTASLAAHVPCDDVPHQRYHVGDVYGVKAYAKAGAGAGAAAGVEEGGAPRRAPSEGVVVTRGEITHDVAVPTATPISADMLRRLNHVNDFDPRERVVGVEVYVRDGSMGLRVLLLAEEHTVPLSFTHPPAEGERGESPPPPPPPAEGAGEVVEPTWSGPVPAGAQDRGSVSAVLRAVLRVLAAASARLKRAEAAPSVGDEHGAALLLSLADAPDRQERGQAVVRDHEVWWELRVRLPPRVALTWRDLVAVNDAAAPSGGLVWLCVEADDGGGGPWARPTHVLTMGVPRAQYAVARPQVCAISVGVDPHPNLSCTRCPTCMAAVRDSRQIGANPFCAPPARATPEHPLRETAMAYIGGGGGGGGKGGARRASPPKRQHGYAPY